MSPNQTSEWNFMTLPIFQELPLFNFERLDELCPRIGHPVKIYDNLNFLSAFVFQFRASRYIMSSNRTSVWKVMSNQICQELSLFNFERLDILCPRIAHPSEILWTFKFLESFHCSISSVLMSYVLESDIRVKCYDHSNLSRASVVQFRASRWVISPNRTSCENFWPFEFLECFRCSISSVSIFYVLESDIRVKSYEQSNLSRASVVLFRASRCIMSPNSTSEWNFMTIQNSRELPLFNFERLDELCPRIRYQSEMLWPFEFVESFRCSISSV